MKRLLSALLMLMLALCPAALAEQAEHPVVCISIDQVGDIYAELYPEYAPITVENFLNLAGRGFYDGLTFHRIISGFMIQGGDPLGNGTGGSEEKIKGEFSANGVENPLTHERGVLSMARSSDMNGASSQFFIMHDDSAYLDGQYAAFGRVIAGQWVVDRICQETPVQDDNGTVLREDQPVILSVRMTDAETARQAAQLEAENGAPGESFADPLSPLGFPMPEGWRLTEQGAASCRFASLDGADQLLLFRQNTYDSLPAAYKQQLSSQGVSRQDLDTQAYQRAALTSMTRLDDSLFSEETHGGVLFYTAESESAGSPVTCFVGANDGYVYMFVYSGARADDGFRAVEEILDQITFRKMK